MQNDKLKFKKEIILKNRNPQLTAILLLGHGSPVSEANGILHGIARAVKTKGGYEIVQPAFLQFGHPDFSEAVDILVKQGVQRIIVQPYFLYMGAHVRKDLPLQVKAVKGRYPELEIILAPHLGYHDKLIEVVVERIESVRSSEFVVHSKENNLHRNFYKLRTTNHELPLTQHPIERESFRIISEQLDESRFSPSELPIIKRVIHATGDFEYADLIRFSKNAIETGIDAITRGADIITDVRMVEVGINKRLLSEWGGKVICRVEDAGEMIKEGGSKTRTEMGIGLALKESHDIGIIAIGNAPSALLKAIEILNLPLAPRPSPLVIGVPVGFVGAEASKDELMRLPIPHISIRGRKGGSTVAVAIVNALLMMAEKKLQVTSHK